MTLLRRLADAPVTRPGLVLLFAVVVSAGLGVGATKLEIDATIEAMLVSGDPDHQAFERRKATFGSDERIIVALEFEDALAPSALDAQRRLAATLLELPEVEDIDALTTVDDIRGDEDGLAVEPLVPPLEDQAVLSPADSDRVRKRVAANSIWHGSYISADRSVAAMHVNLGPAPTPASAARLMRTVNELASPIPHYFAGHPFMKAEIAATMQRDLQLFLPLAAAVMLLLLSAALRSAKLVAAVFGAVALSVVWMLGAMGWAGLPLTALSNTAPTILIALATAYFMHLAVAYQKHSISSSDSRETSDRALRAVRRPTVVAGVTTGIGFASLSLSSVSMISGFGAALALGVIGVVFAACMVLPALLVVLAPSSRGTPATQFPWFGRALFAIAQFAARDTRGVLLAATLALVGCAFGATQLAIDSSGPRAFPPDSLYARSSAFYKAEMSGDVVENIYIDSGELDGFKSPALLESLAAYQRKIEALPEVRKTVSIADYIAKMNRALHNDEVEAEVLPGSRAAVAQYLLLYSLSGDLTDFDELVDPSYASGRVVAYADVESSAASKELRGKLQRMAEESFPRHVSNVLSTEILLSQAADSLVGEQARSFVVALVLILVFVGIAFRTGLGAGLLLLPNLMPIAVALGGMAVLNLPLNQSTAVIGVVALGIAVDGTVHLLSAALASQKIHQNSDASVVYALDSAGRPIVITGIVVAAGFSLLCVSSFRIIAELGATISITMLLCVVADLVLLPAQLLWLNRRQATDQSPVLLALGGQVFPAIEIDSSAGAGLFRLVGAETAWRGTTANSVRVSWLRGTAPRDGTLDSVVDMATPVVRLAWRHGREE